MYQQEQQKIKDLLETAASYEFDLTGDEGEGDALPFTLLQSEQFEEGQVGFRHDDKGEAYINGKEGGWQESWFVIGTDDEVGQPLVVDASEKDFPVYFAVMQEGNWSTFPVSPSLVDLLAE